MTELVMVNCLGKGVKPRQEHLGLGYLKSYLGEQGINSAIVDDNFLTLGPENLATHVLNYKPSVVGFSSFFNNISDSIKTIQFLRAAGFTGHICLGGHYASFHFRNLLENFNEIDSIVIGEGEYTLADLMHRISRGENWRELAGLARRDQQGRPALTARRSLVPDLDDLPFPDRSPYLHYKDKNKNANIASSRGCYGQCSFCSVSAFYRLSSGSAWRPRSPKNLVDEMAYLADRGVSSFHFVDDNFMGPGNTGQQRAVEIGREISKRNLHINFDIDCRASDVNKEVLAFLMQAGLRQVGIGVESMVPRQLELYRKGVSVEQNLHAVEILTDLGLDFHAYFIPIEPYVTIEELLQNLEMMERIGLEHILDDQILTWLVALEGTSIIQDLRHDGLLYQAPAGCIDFEFSWGHPYLFRDRRLGHLFSELLALYYQYQNLRERLLEVAEPANPLIQSLFRQLTKILKGHKFQLFREMLLAARTDTAAISGNVPPDRLKSLTAEVSHIIDSYNSGAFNTFQTRRLSLGGQVITYPPPEVTRLAEELFQNFAADTF